MNELINDKGVCRTAMATPRLLIIELTNKQKPYISLIAK